MSTIRLVNLTKQYPDVRALDKVNLVVNEGEFFVIFGPSGAGKTTTLRLIAGLESPTEGDVLFGERSAAEIVPELRNVAFTFENYALYPHMSVYENVAYPLRAPIRHFGKKEEAERIEKIVTMLRIDKLMDRRPNQLSGGQKQRVALARSMVREAEVYLLDEPLSHVDAKIRHEMRREFHHLKSTILSTTIYVTHDYMEAISLGDRIAVLSEGKILQCDTPRDLWFNPGTREIASLVSSPKINLFEGRVVRRTGHKSPGDSGLSVLASESLTISVPQELVPQLGPHERISVGIRPSSIRALAADEQATMVCKASVKVSELLGADQMLTVDAMGLRLRMMRPYDFQKQLSIGEELRIGWEMSDLFWFDTETGLNIRHKQYRA